MRMLALRLDARLKSAGTELCGLLIIALALANLCAPLVLTVILAACISAWMHDTTGSRLLGWIAAVAAFWLLYRYVWGTRLHGAVRRAATALLAEK